jgi:hypothetical protein
LAYFIIERRLLKTVADELILCVKEHEETCRPPTSQSEEISTSILTALSFNVAPEPATSESHKRGSEVSDTSRSSDVESRDVDTVSKRKNKIRYIVVETLHTHDESTWLWSHINRKSLILSDYPIQV